MKLLLENTSPKEAREILEHHVKELQVDDVTREVILFIDKKYTFNDICSGEYMDNLLDGVKKVFWDEYAMVLKLKTYIKKDEEIHHFEKDKNVPFSVMYRERNVPYTVHYYK